MSAASDSRDTSAGIYWEYTAMKNYKIVALSLSLATPLIALAGESEDPIIDSVAAAYGGDTLLNLFLFKKRLHCLQ